MNLVKRLSILPLILLFVLHVSAASYVASANSDVYHISSCGHAAKIKSSNLLTFPSADEAEESGRRPCSFCGDKIAQARKSDTVSKSSPSKAKTEIHLIEKTVKQFVADVQKLLSLAASGDQIVKIKTGSGYAILISEEQWNLLVESLNLSVKSE